MPIPSAVDYSVHLADWNPKREDWVDECQRWWLELRRGQSELLPIENGELKAIAGSRGVPALHFLDGLRELYPDIELSAYVINLSGESAQEWKCTPEGTFCVEEVCPPWDGRVVLYWKKDGRLMIVDRKPVAEELLGFAGNPFVMVDGVPLSITLDAAKEHVWKLAEKAPHFVRDLLCELPQPVEKTHPSGSSKDDDRAVSAENDFILALKKLHMTNLMRMDTE